MFMRKILITLFCVLFALISVQPVHAYANPAPATWTYLIYMAADNNLDSVGDYSLGLLQKGMTNDQYVKIVALYDHFNGPAEYVQVTSAGLIRTPLAVEPDTADPQNLATFLAWGINTYPADHYVLVVWSHAGGWKYLIPDASSGNRMSIDGFSQALDQIKTQRGKSLDLVIFDACLMSLVEVTYQIANSTNFVVASEESVPGSGFPYDKMIARLVTDTNVSPADYAKGVANDYYDFYRQSNSKSALSVSAVTEGNLQALVTAVDTLSVKLLNNMSKYKSAIGGSRSNAQHQVWGTNGVFWYVDLKVFVQELAKRAKDPAITSLCNAIVSAQAAALTEYHSSNLAGSVNGMGVNFPPNLSKYNDKSYLAQNYQGVNLKFTADTHWDEMILASY
jgi:hypothetical protein